MATKEQLFACALANTPETVRVIRFREITKRYEGCAHLDPKDPDYGMLEAPPPMTREALRLFLHECAHFALHHTKKSRGRRYMEEMEAELWAHARMRQAGIPVPRQALREARKLIRRANQPHMAWIIGYISKSANEVN
jgi:hypothetical protein